jgi:S-DNA-T family DNA segregation ATPase FtsK/SpoIIIE
VSDDEHEELSVHYIHQLDPDEDNTATRAPVYVDVVTKPDDDRRPIIPAGLRGDNLRATTRRHAGNLGHRAGYHLVRLPVYVPLGAFWALVGVFRLLGRQLRWWWLSEQHSLRQEAANRNDPDTWHKLHREAKSTRAWRGIVLAGEAVALAIVVAVLVTAAPWWVDLFVGLAAVPALARIGRPVDKPIVQPAIVTPRFRLITADIVLRALYAAGLGNPDRDGQQITFGKAASREGDGTRVLVDLPYGRTFAEATTVHGKIASGLDVAGSQVFLERDPSSNRRVRMWIADRDPLALPAGRTPLLRNAAQLRPTDIWQPAPLGLSERGEQVTLDMLWVSILVGAQPRQGKTFTARSLGLYAALDPYVKLTVFDASGKPDWRKFSLVADRFGFGLAVTRDGDPAEMLLEALREIKADVQDRYQRLSELPVTICPEGKLTREIARDPKYRMPFRLIILDEFQEYLVGADKEVNKEIAALLVYLVKVAPAAGVSLLDATQKPSGIGAGDVGVAFTAFRDQHVVRIALRTASGAVSDMVLGQGAAAEGYNSSTLLPSHKGVCLLRGASDDTPTVRTYLADAADAERILLAARTLRERAGTLSGMAAGEDVARQARDVLRDVQSVFYAGEAWISWQSIAARLAEQLPEAYADTTVDAISAQVRALGAQAKKGREGTASLWGVPRDQVLAAIQRREIEGKR